MDGGSQPLRTWEKVYWGVFVTGFSVFLLSRVSVWTSAEPEDPAVSTPLAFISLRNLTLACKS